jgi:hypothetical protein
VAVSPRRMILSSLGFAGGDSIIKLQALLREIRRDDVAAVGLAGYFRTDIS